ncbi:type IV pilus assembly protein PilN [Roseateles sp. YR242]|uniref:PilN domain-containing protein n=1 Tax=Roseateles sp. YR242 TaxID=1855305 RepID=UPI0008BE8EF1|nr:PilN domain-containing protein [Roseateles sp. YR242]SEL74845.1 type IV pilus assembly protein PilN [Roseateles sp. YR242]
MILINLLPHREEKRKRRETAFYVGLGMSLVAGALVAGVIYLLLEQMTSSQVERNNFLKSEITKLDEQIKDIATLRAEIDALRARQRAVEDLQSDRNTPVHLLNELAKFTPEGIYLQGIRQTGKSVIVNGQAATNERVSEMLRNLGHTDWLDNPELVEIKLAANNSRDARRLFDFSMKVAIKAATPEAVAGAASAPGGVKPAPANKN